MGRPWVAHGSSWVLRGFVLLHGAIIVHGYGAILFQVLARGLAVNGPWVARTSPMGVRWASNAGP